MIIRPEAAGDVAAIYAVNEAAFGRKGESELVNALRAGGKVTLSLVAEDQDRIVGHILFSPMTIRSEEGQEWPAVGLGPVAVHPDFQRQGIGARLCREGLAACQAAGEQRAIVLGHSDYYPRFGFVPAARYGIRCAFEVPEEVFMALELAPGAFTGCKGVAHYQPEFEGV